jgi:hypothetical protein
MQALAVVEAGDVVGHAKHGFRVVRIIALPNALHLQVQKEAFSDGVISAVTFAVHAADEALLGQQGPGTARSHIALIPIRHWLRNSECGRRCRAVETAMTTRPMESFWARSRMNSFIIAVRPPVQKQRRRSRNTSKFSITDSGVIPASDLFRQRCSPNPSAHSPRRLETSVPATDSKPQFELHWAGVTRSYGKLPALMKQLRERLVSLLKEERPGRKCDRAVRATPQRYAVRKVKKLP